MSHTAKHRHDGDAEEHAEHGPEHDHDRDRGRESSDDHADRDGHAHDQGHDHGSMSPWSRFTHAVSEMVGGHSHDAVDQVDEGMEADSAGRRALLISSGGLALTAAIQAVVVVLSGSVALLGDTLHNVADALTAVPLLIAFRLARRAPTKRYTYGYGRAEDLGGLFVIAMIALSSGLAAYEAIDRLVHPRTVTHLWFVAAAGVIGFAGNEIVPNIAFGLGAASAAPLWSPTACTHAPTGSPASRCCSAQPASAWAGNRPTRSSAW
jgi:hypothetical protein